MKNAEGDCVEQSVVTYEVVERVQGQLPILFRRQKSYTVGMRQNPCKAELREVVAQKYIYFYNLTPHHHPIMSIWMLSISLRVPTLYCLGITMYERGMCVDMEQRKKNCRRERERETIFSRGREGKGKRERRETEVGTTTTS
jgi:hypothetical protein